jgi:hypothetical protein
MTDDLPRESYRYCHPQGAEMTSEQLNKRVERTLKRNQAAIKQANSRSQRLNRAAERSTFVVDQAVRKLRQGAAG